MKYAMGSLVNMSTLVIGLLLGFLLGTAHIEVVHSQASPETTDTTQYEEVTPGVTTSTMAVHTFLAHRIATDQLMVNGYDIMALHEGVLDALKAKQTLSYRDVDAIVERAKIPKPLRLHQPAAPQPISPADKPNGVKP